MVIQFLSVIIYTVDPVGIFQEEKIKYSIPIDNPLPVNQTLHGNTTLLSLITKGTKTQSKHMHELGGWAVWKETSSLT